MATVTKLGSLLLDGTPIYPGGLYTPGQTIGFGDGQTLQWVVVNGLLISAHPLLLNIDWDDLDKQSLVFGKQVSINGAKFLCRLLKVGKHGESDNEWDAALDVVGEDDGLWQWGLALCWGQDDLGCFNRHAHRGLKSARHWDYDPANFRYGNLGYRPAMELLSSEQMTPGSRICAIGGQSILYGTLLETTDYDLLVQPEQASMLIYADAGKFYAELPDGTIAVDNERMAVQTIREA